MYSHGCVTEHCVQGKQWPKTGLSHPLTLFLHISLPPPCTKRTQTHCLTHACSFTSTHSVSLSPKYWKMLQACWLRHFEVLQSIQWNTVCVKKNDADIRNVFPKCICGTAAPQIGRLLLRVGRFFQEVEGFFRRGLGLYTHKFPKRSAALLTDLPELRFVFRSCVCVF